MDDIRERLAEAEELGVPLHRLEELTAGPKLHPLEERALKTLDDAIVLAALGITDPQKMLEAEEKIMTVDPKLLPDMMIGLLAYSSGAATAMTADGMTLGAEITEAEQAQVNKAVSTAEMTGKNPIEAAVDAEGQVHQTRMMRFQHKVTVMLTLNAVAAAMLKHHTEAPGGWPSIVQNSTRTLRRISDLLVGRYIQDHNQQHEQPTDEASAVSEDPGTGDGSPA